MSFGTAARFALLPVHKSDLVAGARQWRLIARVLHQTYQILGLIAPEQGFSGIQATLRAAGAGWWRRWGRHLSAGWNAGAGHGLDGRVGSVWLVIWQGRREIVRDLAAVAIGWSGLAILAVIALWALFGTFIGAAHAATALAGDSDLARAMLGTVFPFLGAGTVLTQALGKLAAGLSVMAMTVGGIAALWSAFVMLYDYTSDYDKARQHYSPWLLALRLVIAMPLLVPISGGWNAAQRMVGFVARSGSDMASDAWTAMVANLSDSKTWVVRPTIDEAALVATISALMKSETCMAATNLNPAKEGLEEVAYEDGSYNYYLTGAAVGWGKQLAVADGCGKVAFRQITKADGISSGLTTQVIQVQEAAFAALQAKVRATAEQYVKLRVACLTNDGTCAPDPAPAALGELPAFYRSTLQSGLESVWSTANASAATQLAEAAKTGGWVAAGTWAQQISALQSSIDGAGNALPTISPPKTKTALGAAAGTVDETAQALANGLSVTDNPTAEVAEASQGAFEAALNAFFEKLAFKNLFDKLVEIDSVQPLAALSSIGKWVYGTAMALVGGAFVTGLIPGLGSLSDGLRWLATAVGLPMMVAGLGLAYLVPALPFIRFLFAVLAWIVSVFECVMLIPLTLVMMVTADRGGVIAPAARAGVFTVVAVFIRPLLTVAGFIFGIALMGTGIQALNGLIIPTIKNSMDGGTVAMAFLGYLFIYAGIAYVIVNSSAKMAEVVPATAYRWLNANASGERDDGAAVGAVVAGAVSRVRGGGGGGGGVKPSK